MFAVEFTVSGGFYHTHLHIIAFRTRFFDVQDLKDLWLKTTGDSSVIRLDRIEDYKGGIREVLKYVTKPASIADFTADNMRHYVDARNIRLSEAFGEFKAFAKDYDPEPEAHIAKAEEGGCCSACGDPLFGVSLAASDLGDFYRRIEASLTMASQHKRE
jgi:hypothetical protein